MKNMNSSTVITRNLLSCSSTNFVRKYHLEVEEELYNTHRKLLLYTFFFFFWGEGGGGGKKKKKKIKKKKKKKKKKK